MPTPTKPRLKQGETPSSPSFVKRMREYNRQVALAEATKAKEEQEARESAARAKRDVLAETKSKPKAAPAKKKATPSKPKAESSKKRTRVAESGRAALEGRAKSIEEAIEGGIKEADEDNKPKRKKNNGS